MPKSSNNPDRYDADRDNRLTDAQDAGDRIAALESKFAAAEERERGLRDRIYSYAYADAMRWGSQHDKADAYAKAQASAEPQQADASGEPQAEPRRLGPSPFIEEGSEEAK